MVNNSSLGLGASLAFTLCLFSAEAAIFDPGAALKADMAQSTPTNPYTDAKGGGWTFGKANAVSNGTLTTLANKTANWGDSFKGFSDSVSPYLPTIQVNTGKVAVAAGGGLTSAGYTISPGEIVLHPDKGTKTDRFAIIRFTVPQTSVYAVAATFRDVSINTAPTAPGVDVHVVINGIDITNAVVSADGNAPAGSVRTFTADLRSLSLTNGSTIDFVMGPNGTLDLAYQSDGTALRAMITDQTPDQAENINLDINGYKRGGVSAPGTNNTYSGETPVGSAGDFWNRATVADLTVAGITVPNLRLTDGLTNSTVSFSLSAVNGGLLGADRISSENGLNPLLDDYVYIANTTAATNRFTIAGLIPNNMYDLYFYSRAGTLSRPGRFVINGMTYDSVNAWFTTNGDYAVCADIAADSSGAITGDFCRAVSGIDAVFNGLQIIGTFPRRYAEIINLDINGYAPGQDSLPATNNAYSGAARFGSAGDFWNQAAIADSNVTSVTVPNLRLSDGLTNSTVSVSLCTVGGGFLRTDRIDGGHSLNTLLDDYVYVYAETNRFTIAGLVPSNTYDLYFYSRTGTSLNPGRFVINGMAYCDIDQQFSTTNGGGDYAVCAGITADSSGAITGDLCRAYSPLAGALNGLQIIGMFPRQRAVIVNFDINGYKPTDPDPVPGPADVYSGAARIGSSGDYWNSATVANATAAAITVSHLRFTDGTNKSTVSFSMSRAGGSLLNADRNTGNTLNALLGDYVYIIDSTTNRFTISGLVPNNTYDLYLYGRAGIVFNPGRFVINGVTYDTLETWYPAGGGGDCAVCAGIAADSGGTITGDFCRANPSLPGVFNGFQIIGTIPRLPPGTLIRIY